LNIVYCDGNSRDKIRVGDERVFLFKQAAAKRSQMAVTFASVRVWTLL